MITVDGCPMECSKKVVEEAGFDIAKSIVLTRDIGMKKKALHEDIGKDLKPVMQYVLEGRRKTSKRTHHKINFRREINHLRHQYEQSQIPSRNSCLFPLFFLTLSFVRLHVLKGHSPNLA